MIRISIATISTLLFAVLFYSCGDDPISSDAVLSTDLAGTSWKLYSVEAISDTSLPFDDNGIWEVPQDDQYLVGFNPDSTVNAFFYCEECPAGESSFFEQDDENSVSINFSCDRYTQFIDGPICRQNHNVKYRIKSAKSVDAESGFLRLHYNMEHAFDGGSSSGIMSFTPVNESTPQEIDIEILRGNHVSKCSLDEENVDLTDESANLRYTEEIDDLTLMITTEAEFETYLNCSDDVGYDAENEIILAGASKRHPACIHVYDQRAFFLNEQLYNATAIRELACDPIMRTSYIVKIPREYRDQGIEFITYMAGSY